MQRQDGNGVFDGVAPLAGTAGVAGGGERRLLGGARLVDRLVERVFVDVAVERVGADVAVVGVARRASGRAVRRWRPVRLRSVERLSVVSGLV